jgi:hypothetical protein
MSTDRMQLIRKAIEEAKPAEEYFAEQAQIEAPLAKRETLIQIYDRLQQRKTRRKQWLFYAEASTEQLADLVLKYLDEEIEDRKAGGYQ